jgi:Fic family protein
LSEKTVIVTNRYIYETSTISTLPGETVSINDITETVNHFRCFDFMLDTVDNVLSEGLIKKYHYYLKRNTVDELRGYLVPGEYKLRPNTVGNTETADPADVSRKMAKLLDSYNSIPNKTTSRIIDFHYAFERIHPFQEQGSAMKLK